MYALRKYGDQRRADLFKQLGLVLITLMCTSVTDSSDSDSVPLIRGPSHAVFVSADDARGYCYSLRAQI